MDNIIIDFDSYKKGTRRDAEEAVYRYDTGRTLELHLPENIIDARVYFWTVGMEEALGVDPVSIEGGTILVSIPDSVLQTEGSEVRVYVSLTDSAHIATDYEGRIEIRSRPE